MSDKPARKLKATVQIDAELHGLLKVLKPLLGKDINEMLEPGGWQIVRENRDQLERALGREIAIPDPQQLELSEIAAR
ncbi:MAG: hypothetical protein ABMA13_23460 [Chthoniobacteraceae bacterium]